MLQAIVSIKKTEVIGNLKTEIMRTLKTEPLLIGCCAALIVLAIGCSNDNPSNPLGCGNDAWAENIQKELNDLAAATVVLQEAQTTANCVSYKQAANNYLDALEGVRACVPSISKAEFDQAVSEAKQNLEQEDCDI